jgi:small subunit ribosomal protein S9
MVCRKLAQGLTRAVDTIGSQSRTQCARTTRRSLQPPTWRCISTTAPRPAEVETEIQEPFTAAKPFNFEAKDATKDSGRSGGKGGKGGKDSQQALRIVPASPSYFSAKPTFTDDFISLSALLRKVATLPTIPPAEAPKVAWKTVEQYRIMTNEPVKTQRFHKMLHILRRLNCIHPQLMPDEVVQTMKRYKKPSQPGDVIPKPGVIDELGRAKGVGRRKTSSAVAWLVEGEGEALINGQSLAQFFGRLHHRESAVWALKATQRLDKYNLFGLVQGGGSTGQAEAMTLAVAKALLVHEPALKPALRRAGCITRDPRKVERKKPGHVKARKMPTWVKR